MGLSTDSRWVISVSRHRAWWKLRRGYGQLVQDILAVRKCTVTADVRPLSVDGLSVLDMSHARLISSHPA